MNILFVDDEYDRYNIAKNRLGQNAEIDYCPTTADALLLLFKSIPDVIFLDHDMGVEDTTVEIARYIADHPSNFEQTTIIIHSMNSIGASNLYSILKYLESPVHIIPGAWMKVSYNEGLIISI